MLMNTHFMISKSVINNIDQSKSFFINESNFIYGNMKPDAFSKYVLKKHYLDESLDMIISKIKYLTSLTLNGISKYFSVSKLSQELGVICHFLCDFFCVAHSQRWELKHSMSKHISYEKELACVAKELDLSKFKFKFKGESITNNNFEDFFNNLYSEYKNRLDYENDLLFSTYVCNSVLNYVLDSILSNTVTSYNSIACV